MVDGISLMIINAPKKKVVCKIQLSILGINEVLKK